MIFFAALPKAMALQRVGGMGDIRINKSGPGEPGSEKEKGPAAAGYPRP
ncbi:hypothetical protein MKQ70_20480 [Chitinophaga sedimenti]|nr:hypothetical protein [Chitinophaga sedimenti]MCK7557251.1 hypothetical protein [Chitinophaga sedimenti]